MLGSSHNIDPSFVNNLPLNLRDPASALIRVVSLKDMLKMRQDPSCHFLHGDFQLTNAQWQTALNAAILTKVSYFEIEIGFPNVYINKLFKIASYAYGLPNKPAPVLYQAMIHEHHQMAAWIKKALLIQQQNLRRSQTREAGNN
ncbi:hypothetical protein MNBD_GAMMA04-538 [hydrothermal vent metagenome]|uniref:Uncharacterized protein n=1 Tax=hydrothermal vent metagenome TaxID=652676 RepID=A0A3B0WUD4_9ZZZZ